MWLYIIHIAHFVVRNLTMENKHKELPVERIIWETLEKLRQENYMLKIENATLIKGNRHDHVSAEEKIKKLNKL